MLFLPRRRTSCCRISGKKIVLCLLILTFFLLVSPIRIGARLRKTWISADDALIRLSLFLGLGMPSADTQSENISDPASSDPASPELDVSFSQPSAKSDRGIYASAQPIYTTSAKSEVVVSIQPQDTVALIEYRNETSYTPNTQAFLENELVISPQSDDPLVLIVHTHTSESYLPDTQYPYTPDDNIRTLDSNYNVVRVGETIAKRLRDAGIGVIHDTTLHDYPSYNGSYSRSLKTVEAVLMEYPSIRIVIDVHRDAILDSSGLSRATYAEITTETKKVETAQLMLVIGTDEGGLRHPDWEYNLSFAVKLQSMLLTMYPGLMRPVNLRQERFNQHVAVGSILLEVGSSGNTLGEALTAAELFADGLISLLQS